MSKFKKGDRIVCYFYDEIPEYTRRTGIVNETGTDSSIIEVWFHKELKNSSSIKRVHSKSCRRLVKKQRREVWIRARDIPNENRSGHAYISSAELVGEDYVRFIEAPRKK